MEDYDIFNEMKNLDDKMLIVFIEDDEDFMMNILLNYNIEGMPIRFSYDLSSFSDEYIECTKKLFTYYYTEDNSYENELLRLKKHFQHYQRKPKLAYIPSDNKYQNLLKMLSELGILCVNKKEQLIEKINDIKLILIDSDGTLRKSDGTITDRLKNVISKHRSLGNKIVICTARPRYHTIEVMEKSNASEIVISSNGNEIYDTKEEKIIFNVFIDKEEVFKLVEMAYLNDLRLILSIEDYDYVTKEIRNSNQRILDKNNYKNELSDKYVKQCMFIDEKQSLINKVKKDILKNKNISIVDEKNENDSYYEDWFCVADKNASKGNALKVLANYLNVDLKNTIAIGNDKNDLSMFETSGYSVAVDNASNEIKSKVDYITLSNDEDGVAKFLESLIE